MGTYYIPRNVKGETRILYIFTVKSLITTAVGALIGSIFLTPWIIALSDTPKCFANATDDKILCFDDLERANIDIIDIFGWSANSTVSHIKK